MSWLHPGSRIRRRRHSLLRMGRVPAWAALISLMAPLGSATAQHDPLTPEAVLAVSTVASPVVSPAGDRAVYVVHDYLPAEMRHERQLWLLDPATGRQRPLTTGAPAASPRWTPDGQGLYFLREGQVWRLRLDGGEPERITDIPGGVAGFANNPNPSAPPDAGLLLHRKVDPACAPGDWECTAATKSRWAQRPGLVSELFPLRHWSAWRDSLRSHLFLGNPAANRWLDLTPGALDCPPMALARGAAYQFDPTGNSIALIMNLDGPAALSTNNDIFLLPIAAASGSEDTAPAWDRYRIGHGLSGGGGNDDSPVFSPDGRHLAYCSMKRAGYESDLRQIVLLDRESGRHRCLTCELDRSAGSLTWSLDSRYLYFTAYDRGASSLSRIEIATGARQRILRAGAISGLAALAGDRLLLCIGSSRLPGEIFLADPAALLREPERYTADLAVACDGRFGTPEQALPAGAPLRQLTFHNWPRLASLALRPPEHVWFTGARGDSVHGMIFLPPDPDPAPQSVPLVLVLHGGPQWAYQDFWMRSYNFQMLAAQGYAVAAINFHGSTGFGIEFQDAIRGHWGDVPGEDIERGVAFILDHLPQVDPARIGAIGRSYGGFLANWLNGHSSRFRCIVAHSGSSNEYAAWGSTEELWFPEWEFGGPPWEHADVYWANSPLRAAKTMRTPTLLIHGQRDYRVDLSESLQTYATLRRQGVRARFLTFEDQGHHIQDPRSWLFMWQELFGWLDEYLH